MQKRGAEKFLFFLVPQSAYEKNLSHLWNLRDLARTGIAESVASRRATPPLRSVGQTTPLTLESALVNRLASTFLYKLVFSGGSSADSE